MLIDIEKRLKDVKNAIEEGKKSNQSGSWWSFWEKTVVKDWKNEEENILLFGDFLSELSEVMQTHELLSFLQRETAQFV